MSIAQYLAQLIIPSNLMVALLLIATVLWIIKQRRIALFIALAGTGWALFWSLPVSSMWLGGHLENRYEYVQAEQMPNAQAIVVLGGHTANNRANWFEAFDPSTARSRIQRGAKLFDAQRAPLIVVSGAALDGGTSEAQVMARYLRQHGINDDHIVIEERSYTTKENALFSAELLHNLQVNRILLVTSALHMPRSVAAFEKEGLEVIAAPVAPQITPPKNDLGRLWKPSLQAMNASRSIIKEYAGLLVYWVRSWI